MFVVPGIRALKKTPKTIIKTTKVMIGLITDQYNPRSDPTYFWEISLLIKFQISPRYSRMEVIAFYVPVCDNYCAVSGI
jgi:hypothetical protein